MNKLEKIAINGEFYVEYSYLIKELKNNKLSIQKDGLIEEIYIETTTEKKLESTNNTNELTDYQFTDNEIEYYWEQAACHNKRELFMNTIRPELKEVMGYDFSEIELEKRAKKLCARWYFHENRGEKYEGPYLIS
tara:strand:+ start:672 stop:1076 length:405 start_codon:yes stop_codon:yes gene_type:complete